MICSVSRELNYIFEHQNGKCPPSQRLHMPKKRPVGTPLGSIRDSPPNLEPISQLGGLILAGGKSLRLREKCLRPLHGRPLIAYVFDCVSAITQQTVVAARTTTQRAKLKKVLPGARIVLDGIRTQSPLVGFLSGLRVLQTPYVFAAPCDAPLIEPKLIHVLYSKAVGNDCALPKFDGKLNPLLSVYNRTSAIRASTIARKNGELSMHEMLTHLEKVVAVSKVTIQSADPDLSSLLNINTNIELAKARRILRKRLNAKA